VINCRPDRVERNGQMGEIIPDLKPDNVFVIGHPAKSAIDAIPAEWRDRAVDLGGERRSAEEFMPALLDRMASGSSLVAIGHIHGQGEELLEYLAELPADESESGSAGEPRQPAAAVSQPARLDPFATYPVAYEERYQASQTQEIPVVRIPAQPSGPAADAHRAPEPQTGQQWDPHARARAQQERDRGAQAEERWDHQARQQWDQQAQGREGWDRRAWPHAEDPHGRPRHPTAEGGGQPPSYS
jgi:hypothetical protein